MINNFNLPMAFLVALVPSRLKIWLLRRMGASIGTGCYIGLSLIHAQKIEIGDHVRIASFNLLHRLTSLKMGQGSRMNGFNWITGAGMGKFCLGHHSAIQRLHFFDASGSIDIGDNSIIAGRGSHLFTHGISSTNLEDIRPIIIGPWCYVGSSSRFVPGSGVSEGTFVGMGSVVTKRFADPYVLVGGNLAIIKKRLSAKDVYYDRPFLPHDHHPRGYAPDITSLPLMCIVARCLDELP